MPQKQAQFRFYEELNDFLPEERQKTTFPYYFNLKPSVKDAIEAIGVPHAEVELILANGRSVGFDYHLRHGDRIAVYPMFESLDVTPLVRLREKPLREIKFVLDVHLGKLARLLRLLGFDAVYRNDYTDEEIVNISVQEHRVILTRDRGLLKIKKVTHGYWLRSTQPMEQIIEVLRRFDLKNIIAPLNRCLECNGKIVPVPKEEIEHRLPPKTAAFFDEFCICQQCARIYWRGSHYQKLINTVAGIRAQV